MATHQPTTVTREALESAPMFTMFNGRPPTAIGDSTPKLWAVFNEGQQDFSDAVDAELERRGIVVDGHIEADDHLRRVLEEGVEGEHKKPLYDDVDASLLALNAGMKLVKCPDDLESPHWRMYVVHQVDLHQWRAAVEGCTRAEAKNRNFFALYGGCGAGPLPRPGIPVEQVDFDLSRIKPIDYEELERKVLEFADAFDLDPGTEIIARPADLEAAGVDVDSLISGHFPDVSMGTAVGKKLCDVPGCGTYGPIEGRMSSSQPNVQNLSEEDVDRGAEPGELVSYEGDYNCNTGELMMRSVEVLTHKAIVVCANWPHPNGKCHLDMEIETDCLYDINASRVAIQAAIAEYVALGFEIDVTATDPDCKWVEFTVMGLSKDITATEVQELLENFLALLTSNAVLAEEN